MKKFLAIYLGTPDALGDWHKLGDAQRKEREQHGIKAWGDWMEKHSSAVLDTGGPLGKTKQVSKDGIKDVRNAMTGYVVIQAESHEAAARMFENHPHFTIFPGQGVEIMECLPIPGRS
jgi:hypothetical protein